MLLKVNARLSDQKSRRIRRVVALAVGALVVVTTAALIGFTVRQVGGWLFWNNDHYQVRTLKIHVDGQVITEQHVREYTGLSEGTNLFAMNIRKLREGFLTKTPMVGSMTICRYLPDTIQITIAERVTLARIGQRRIWAVDREGYVFNLRSPARDLPIITGYADSLLRPGVQVDLPVRNALEVIDVCHRTRIGDPIKIASVDVSAKEYLELFLAGGERVRLAWDGMGTATPAARQKLERKMNLLTRTLEASERRGYRIANLDLTYSDQYIPAQEY